MGIRHVIFYALNWSYLKYCRQSTLEILSTVDTWNIVDSRLLKCCRQSTHGMFSKNSRYLKCCRRSTLEILSTVDTWFIVDSRHLKYCRQSTLDLLSTVDTWNDVDSLDTWNDVDSRLLECCQNTVDTWNIFDSQHLKCCRQFLTLKTVKLCSEPITTILNWRNFQRNFNQVTLHAKMAISDLQQHNPWNCTLIKNVEDNVDLVTWKVFDSDHFYIASNMQEKKQVTFLEHPKKSLTIKINNEDQTKLF